MKEDTVAVNLIVLAVTGLVAGLVLLWASSARLRGWIEAPKYRVLRWPDRYPDGSLPGRDANDELKPR